MYDVIIIGCGIVGSATAYSLSKYNIKVGILEAENDVATGTTKANSAIIHAGYDPKPNTLMAKLNVEGSRLTKEICKKLQVPYEQIGSLVLAFDEAQMEKIKKLLCRGEQNGVAGLQILDKEAVKAIEPLVADNVIGALYAPTAAIVSPWELCLAMAEVAVKNGVEIHLENAVTAIEKTDYGFLIVTNHGCYKTKTIFNASGICGDKVHNMVASPSFKIYPRSGQYFLLDKQEGTRARHIIFQCPVDGTKGVLVAPTVHGNLLAGPDSSLQLEDSVKTTQEGLDFVREAAKRSIPSINYKENIRNFAGLRATSDREDFIIEEASGTKGFFDLSGIKSPGLSAAAAIGIEACSMLEKYGIKLEEKKNFIDYRKRICLKELTTEEKQELIKQNPDYGKVICRCETITQGEILDCLATPIPPVSIDGVKRRVSAGMGRCQGGFCGAKVMEILAKAQGKALSEILQDKAGTQVLIDRISLEDKKHNV